VAATRLDEKKVWEDPANAENMLAKFNSENNKLFEFEKLLSESGKGALGHKSGVDPHR